MFPMIIAKRASNPVVMIQSLFSDPHTFPKSEIHEKDNLPALITLITSNTLRFNSGLLSSAEPIKAQSPKLEPAQPLGLICSFPKII